MIKSIRRRIARWIYPDIFEKFGRAKRDMRAFCDSLNQSDKQWSKWFHKWSEEIVKSGRLKRRVAELESELSEARAEIERLRADPRETREPWLNWISCEEFRETFSSDDYILAYDPSMPCGGTELWLRESDHAPYPHAKSELLFARVPLPVGIKTDKEKETPPPP